MQDVAKKPQVVRVVDVPPAGWNDSRGVVHWATLFGGDGNATDQLTAGVATLEPQGFLALHRHPPAEMYYILEGRGRMTIDGADVEVAAGTGVFIPGNAEHGIRNDGATPLRFLYAFAVDRFADITYSFS
jgi:quercetin dioxygenase-like cupin family protein